MRNSVETLKGNGLKDFSRSVDCIPVLDSASRNHEKGEALSWLNGRYGEQFSQVILKFLTDGNEFVTKRPMLDVHTRR